MGTFDTRYGLAGPRRFFFAFIKFIFELRNIFFQKRIRIHQGCIPWDFANFPSFLCKKIKHRFLPEFCVKLKKSNCQPIPTKTSGNAHWTRWYQMSSFEAENPYPLSGATPIKKINFSKMSSIEICGSVCNHDLQKRPEMSFVIREWRTDKKREISHLPLGQPRIPFYKTPNISANCEPISTKSWAIGHLFTWYAMAENKMKICYPILG